MRFCQSFLAIFVWVLAFTKLFVLDVETELLRWIDPSLLVLNRYRAAVYLSAFCIILALCKWRVIRQLVGYVLIFPAVVAFWWIPKALLRHWEWLVIFSPVVNATVKNLRGVTLTYLMALLAFSCVWAFNDYRVLLPACFGLVVFLTREFCVDIRNVINPASAIGATPEALRAESKKLVAQIRRAISEKMSQKGTEKGDKELKAEVHSLYVIHGALSILAARLKKALNSGRLELFFVLRIAWTFAVTVLIFASLHGACYKLLPLQYSVERTANFLSFLELSFCDMVMSNRSTINAVGDMARTIGHMQNLFALVLLGSVFGLLFSRSRERLRSDIDASIEEYRAAAAELEQEIGPEFGMTWEEVEQLAAEQSIAIVNWLRTQRRLPALDSIDEPFVDSESEERLRAGIPDEST